jgi:hypothetical protein
VIAGSAGNTKLETGIQSGYSDSQKSQHPRRSAFRVKKKDHKILAQDKRKLQKRLRQGMG